MTIQFNPSEWSPDSKVIRRIRDSIHEDIEEVMIDTFDDEPDPADEVRWEAWYDEKYQFFFDLLMRSMKGTE